MMTVAREGEPALASGPERDRSSRKVPRIANLMVIGSLCVAVLVVLLATLSLYDSRQDTWARARQASDNLLVGVTAYVERHLRVYTLALDLAADGLQHADRHGDPAHERQMVLDRIAAVTGYVDNVIELDADGDVVRSVHPLGAALANLGQRDFFSVLRDNPETRVYVSQPFRNELRGGEQGIGFSRRLTDAQGRFAGAVVIIVRLSYIGAFFSTIEMGKDGFLLLLSLQGRVLLRQPPGGSGLGADVGQTQNVRRGLDEQVGSFVAYGTFDGIERLYTFTRIPDQPLIAAVAFSTQDIFSDWRRRLYIIGFITLLTCSLIVTLAVILRRELIRRAWAEAELAILSITDGLTGLSNRRRLDQVVNREWRRTSRTGSRLAFLLIDVDRFKLVNDRHGHTVGDEVLKALARVIAGSIRRPGDEAARFGGEEFAVVLPDTDPEGALRMAEAIRARCEALDAGLPRVTVSIGVSAVQPAPALSPAAFVEAADKALYRAKAAGRNCVVLAD